MRLKKILNNNAVLIMDGKSEKIAIGAGIAYGKRKNDMINIQDVEKIFVMKENIKLQQLLSRIPEQHFIVSEEIISYAEEYLGVKLSEHIHIVLTDHLSFAIERIEQGIDLKNKLLNEIKILYNHEYEIGLWAINRIKEKFNIDVPVDEAAYIALHIHTMKLQGGDYRQAIKEMTIVREMVQVILGYLGIELLDQDIAYQRLITHLRFTLSRINENELQALDDDMLSMIQQKLPESYQCAQMVKEKIWNIFNVELPETELGYIALHTERLKKSNI